MRRLLTAGFLLLLGFVSSIAEEERSLSLLASSSDYTHLTVIELVLETEPQSRPLLEQRVVRAHQPRLFRVWPKGLI